MATPVEIIKQLSKKNKQLTSQLSAAEHNQRVFEQQVDARMTQLESAVFYMFSDKIDEVRTVAAERGDDEDAMQACQEAIARMATLQSTIAPAQFARLYRINPVTSEPLEDDEALEEFLSQPRQLNTESVDAAMES